MPRGGVGIGGHMKGEQRGRRPLRLHEGAVEERREWGSGLRKDGHDDWGHGRVYGGGKGAKTSPLGNKQGPLSAG